MLAALLSLPFPGLGHAARGHFARGAAWLVVDVAALALFITHPHLWLVGALGARLLSAADAVIARPAQRGPAGGGIVAAAFGVWLGAQVVARLPIMVIAETFKLPSNSMAPTMVLGDHFTVLATATPGGVTTVAGMPAGAVTVVPVARGRRWRRRQNRPVDHLQATVGADDGRGPPVHVEPHVGRSPVEDQRTVRILRNQPRVHPGYHDCLRQLGRRRRERSLVGDRGR